MEENNTHTSQPHPDLPDPNDPTVLAELQREADDQDQRRGRRKRGRPRTMIFYRDDVVGTDDAKDFVINRYYISTDTDMAPELFVITMQREVVVNDGKVVGLRSMFRGDIERNAVALRGLDIQRHADSLLRMKSDLLRMDAQYRVDHGLEPVVDEPASKPPAIVIPQHQPAPRVQPRRPPQPPAEHLTHRLKIPAAVSEAVASVPETPVAITPVLGNVLKGW